MTKTGGRRSLAERVLVVTSVIAVAVVAWKLEEFAQPRLWDFFSHISAWMLWVLVIVVPSIPVVYTLVVWWHSRNEKSAHELREDL